MTSPRRFLLVRHSRCGIRPDATRVQRVLTAPPRLPPDVGARGSALRPDSSRHRGPIWPAGYRPIGGFRYPYRAANLFSVAVPGCSFLRPKGDMYSCVWIFREFLLAVSVSLFYPPHLITTSRSRRDRHGQRSAARLLRDSSNQPECRPGHDSPAVPPAGAALSSGQSGHRDAARFRSSAGVHHSPRYGKARPVRHQERGAPAAAVEVVGTGPPAQNDFEMEQELRCTLLEMLYSQRRTDPSRPALSNWDLPEFLGPPREHLEFAIWYLASTKLIMRDDQSELRITAAGVDYIKANHESKVEHTRLRALVSPLERRFLASNRAFERPGLGMEIELIWFVFLRALRRMKIEHEGQKDNATRFPTQARDIEGSWPSASDSAEHGADPRPAPAPARNQLSITATPGFEPEAAY